MPWETIIPLVASSYGLPGLFVLAAGMATVLLPVMLASTLYVVIRFARTSGQATSVLRDDVGPALAQLTATMHALREDHVRTVELEKHLVDEVKGLAASVKEQQRENAHGLVTMLQALHGLGRLQ